jgi:N-methylhydantoinase A/oxoprolinase/acetone carboxylase beta subunit
MRAEGFAEHEVAVEVRESEQDGERVLAAEAVREAPVLELPRQAAGAGAAEPAAHAEVRWPGRGPVLTAIYARDELGVGASVAGPALVEAPETTCAVPPGWSARVDENGTLCLSNEELGDE